MRVCSSYSRLHSTLSHSTCAEVQREDNMRAFPSHSRLHSALSYSPCAIYTQCKQSENNMRARTTHRGYIPISCTHHVYIHRGRTTLMRCSLHTAGYIPVSRTHPVLHTQREDNTDEVFSSHSRLHSCLSHSPCAIYTVQTDGGQHGGVDNHRRMTT